MQTPSERLAAPGTLSALDRARVTLEIAAAHRRVKRAQRHNDDVRAVLAAVRDRVLAEATQVDEPRVVAHRLAGAVARAMPRLPTDSRCLAQSLVLCNLLARRGLDARMIIGVETDGEFGAHAWVELEGEALLHPGQFGRLAEL